MECGADKVGTRLSDACAIAATAPLVAALLGAHQGCSKIACNYRRRGTWTQTQFVYSEPHSYMHKTACDDDGPRSGAKQRLCTVRTN